MTDQSSSNSVNGNQPTSVSRRRVIGGLLGFSILATLGGVFTPIVGYLWPPSRASAGGGGRTEVGTTADFPVGQGKVVPVNDQPVIVVNTPQGGLKAYSAICTHLGCIVEWDESRQLILCPCHDGRFNAINGAIISGPVPAPLAELPLTVETGAIYVSES